MDDAATAVTYNGTWSHTSGETGPYAGTNSYSDVTGDTSTLSFVGTGVTLRAVTAPSHGIVGVSIDGGAEALVDLYSAARTGDVSVWTSPRHTSGTHTIRVRVTGAQRAAATHDWGTVDRFEIADQPVVGTNYRIVNRNSGKRLAVAGESTADGALIVQKTDGGAWTTPATSEPVSATRKVSVSFDGGLKRFYGSGELCGSGQDENQGPLFVLADGAVLKNVVLGAPAADGVHCLGSCTRAALSSRCGRVRLVNSPEGRQVEHTPLTPRVSRPVRAEVAVAVVVVVAVVPRLPSVRP